MSGIFHEGRWYENTDMICRRCGRPVYDSDNPEYCYQCFHCDEDFYSFEVEEQDALYLPPVMVARPVDGITLNEALEYLLDDTGKTRIFQNQPEAEAFLLCHGFTSEDLEHFYFVEVPENTSPLVYGFADFVRFLDENRGEAGHAPLPLHKRIPQAAQISESEWRNIADNQDTGYSCFIVVNVPENQVWVNEDTGAGMALYCFPFLAVMEVAASGAADPWETLLAKYPSAKMSG